MDAGSVILLFPGGSRRNIQHLDGRESPPQFNPGPILGLGIELLEHDTNQLELGYLLVLQRPHSLHASSEDVFRLHLLCTTELRF